jgi:hypothetical protein
VLEKEEVESSSVSSIGGIEEVLAPVLRLFVEVRRCCGTGVGED